MHQLGTLCSDGEHKRFGRVSVCLGLRTQGEPGIAGNILARSRRLSLKSNLSFTTLHLGYLGKHRQQL